MASIALSLLGGLQISVGQQPVTNFATDKVRALFVYLALEQTRAHSRPALAALFWPALSPDAAADNLRKSIYRLRRTLGKVLSDPSAVLVTSRQSLQLAPHAVTVDVLEFQNLLAECEFHEHASLLTCDSCLARLVEAADQYRGELLAGFGLTDAPAFEEWLLFWRETLHHRALQLLTTLSSMWTVRGDAHRALDCITRLLVLDPFREEAHRQKMRLLAHLGSVQQALEQYENCRQLLHAELGVEPDTATKALAEQIRAGEFAPLATLPEMSPAPQPSGSAADRPYAGLWDDLPETGHIFGRHQETTTLTRWLVEERCRLVAVLGMGGIGKTTLAVRVAKEVASQFDLVIWRSLLNAPPLEELLPSLLQELSVQVLVEVPASLDGQLALLFSRLRERRCLLVLDNVEGLFESNAAGAGVVGAGHMRAGYAGYAQLFQRAAETRHNSCLLLTSREQPQGLARWEEDLPAVRTLQLDGLDMAAGQAMLRARGLIVQTAELQALVTHYSGNPLALKLVAETLQELFAGDVTAFLQEETPIFGDIRSVLDGQWVRLSALEKELLVWLAIEREAVSAQTLHANLVQPPSWREFLEALRALRRRSLLEQTAARPGQAAGFMLQNVVIEYLTDRLVEGVTADFLGHVWALRDHQPATPATYPHPFTDSLINSFALLKTQVNEYIRQSQRRMILQPVANRLLARLGRFGVSARMHQLLALMRQELPLAPGYAAGNLLNLLLHLELQEMHFDFSRLCVWQADLRGQWLEGLDLTGAELRAASFTDTFSTIHNLAYSPDGALLAAGLFTGGVRIWRAADGLPLGIYPGHGKPVECLAFSPRGELLVGGSADQHVHIWDARTGQQRARLAGHHGRILAVAFHPSGMLLASGGEDMTIRLWTINRQGEGKCICMLTAHEHWIRTLAFSPDGKWLASGGLDSTIRLWAVDLSRAGREIAALQQVLTDHQDWVWSVAFSPDGTTMASGSRDRTIRLWSVSGDETAPAGVAPRAVLRGHTGGVNVVAFSPDGALLGSSSNDCTIRLWEPQTTAQTGLLIGHDAMVLMLAFDPRRPLLASGSDDHTIRLWNIAQPRSSTLLTILQGHFQGYRTLAFSPDGRLLASGAQDQRYHLWQMDLPEEDLQHGQVVRTVAAFVPDGHALSFDVQGALLASGGEPDTVRLWHLTSNEVRNVKISQLAEITAIALHREGTLVAAGGQQGTIVLTEINQLGANRTRAVLQGHTSVVTALAFSPNAPILASCSHDGAVFLWHLQTGEQLTRLEGHTDVVWSVAFSPDGTMLASSSTDRTIRVWHVPTGAKLQILNGHTERVFAVAFVPDGRTLVSGSADQSLRVWDVATGVCRHILQGHTSWVWALAVHPDGRRVATGSTDATIRLWDLDRQLCLATWHPPGPYAGMNITRVTGISEAQKAALRALGAREEIRV